MDVLGKGTCSCHGKSARSEVHKLNMNPITEYHVCVSIVVGVRVGSSRWVAAGGEHVCVCP